MSAKKKPLAIIISVVTVAILAGGGYFAYTMLQAKTEENLKNLESTGDLLVGSSHSSKEEELSEEEMAPTISKDMRPSRKIVRSLQKENVNLSIEIIELRNLVENLKKEIEDLEEYKLTNKRFAPKRLKDEMADIESKVKSFLLNSEDAGRFGSIQIEIMAAASALEYKEYIIRNRLMVTKQQREKLAVEFLPGYAFCVGDGIELAANNSNEYNLVAKKFRGEENLSLPVKLQKDLDSVISPCQNSLRAQLDKSLKETT
ncbi:MAG: polyhydroxyalkanoate synthesis regulator phasin [Oceanospirillaceae bacterium]|jgi:polyhydroxyalkanoate synthesis regulator phasin